MDTKNNQRAEAKNIVRQAQYCSEQHLIKSNSDDSLNDQFNMGCSLNVHWIEDEWILLVDNSIDNNINLLSEHMS